MRQESYLRESLRLIGVCLAAIASLTPFGSQAAEPIRSIGALFEAASYIAAGQVVRQDVTDDPGLPSIASVFHLKLPMDGTRELRLFLKRPSPKTGFFTVRQFTPEAIPVKEGDRRVWFVRENSPGEFQGPIAYAGDFVVIPDPSEDGSPYFSVVNRLQNRGLWSPDKALWESEPDLSPTLLAKALKDLKVGAPRIKSIMEIAGSNCTPNPIPLELLVASIQIKASRH